MAAVEDLIGASPEIAAVRERVARLLARSGPAARLPPLLLLGETGTGKGLLARMLHRQSPRAGRFVEVNCSALPDTLLESEMFGFERGAFSEARQAKEGLIESAHGGTLFLDEVALLAPALQAKLLKAIEELEVRRLGSTRSRPVDVWVISATNDDLAVRMQQGRFREDLYHRLARISLRIPPLRERGEDVVLLAQHFLDRACAAYAQPRKTFAPDARAALLRHAWGGNVRELANAMDRVALEEDAPVVVAAMLGLAAAPAPRPAMPAVRDELGELERTRIAEALEQTAWNLSRAAARLGLPRNTLRYRMERLGLAPARAARERPPASPDRPAPAETAPAATPAPLAPALLRWEPRRLAFLRVALDVEPDVARGVHDGRAMDRLVEKVETFGGRAWEASASGFVAVFGLEPMEDSPSRAGHAALALGRAAADPVDAAAPRPVRIAMHTVQCLVAFEQGAPAIEAQAKEPAWAVLDALAKQAGPGAIIASGDAAQFLARRFALRPRSGVGSAGASMLVLGRQPSDLDGGRRLTAFSGRRHHLALLESCLAAALGGHGQVVGIVGEAGIGKSRLIAESRRRLGGTDVAYREGTSLSYGTATPYRPVQDILRQACSIGEADTPPEIRDKVALGLAAVGVDASALPYLLQLLGVADGAEALAALTGEAIRQRTVEALRQMVLAASRQRPLVMVVEDLNAIDPSSEALFSALVESLPGAPILFLCTYRPGYRPPWLDRSDATQIALPPLSPEESRAVVRSVLSPGAADALVQAILDRAEGNPFFLEELCRAAEDAPGATAAAPDTVQDLLLARIQRLPAAPRALLQAAAVLGREVSGRWLAAIWDGPESLEEALGVLTSLELLYPRIGRGGEPVQVFKHALTRDVAYATLPPARRQALHGAAGRALEQFYEGRQSEVYDQLAHHFARSANPTAAVEYLARFADRSARAYGHDEAVAAITEALGHVDRLPAAARDRARVELVLRLPRSLMPLGRLEELFAALLGEQERLEALADPALAAQFHYLLGRAHMLGRRDVALGHVRRALADAERAGDTGTMGRAYGLLAMAGALSGQPAQGMEDGRRAVALLERTEDQASLGYAYWAMGLCASHFGAFDDAMDAAARACRIAEAIGDQPQEASAAWVMGVTQAAIGNWSDGIAHCRRAVDTARDALNRAITTGALGMALLEQGDAAAAMGALEQSIPPLHRFGIRTMAAWFTALLAEAQRLDGQLDRAAATASQALQEAVEADFGLAVGWAQHALGRIARARGDRATALARLGDALGTFTTIQSRFQQGRTHLDLAVAWREDGDDHRARRHLDEARDLFARMGVALYQQRAADIAASWGPPGRP